MKRLSFGPKFFVLVLCFALIFPGLSFAQEDIVDEASKVITLSARIQAFAVNGWNRTLGSPATQLRFVDELQFAVGGVFNPDGPAVEIDNDTSLDALMASYAAPDVYLAFFGVPNADTVPNQNILYADYPQLIAHDGTLGPLPQLEDNPEWWGKSNGSRTKDLTVADWLSARGGLSFVCSGDEAFYVLRGKDLIPGGLYTVWGFYFDQETGQLQPDFAFGGTSANVFTADRNGRIVGSRDLSFCPLTVAPEERYQLINLFLVYHPDGRVNATVGHVVQAPPFNGPGMTATPQLMFAIPEEF